MKEPEIHFEDQALLISPIPEQFQTMTGTEKTGHSAGHKQASLSDPDFSGAVEVEPQLGVQHPSYPELPLRPLCKAS